MIDKLPLHLEVARGGARGLGRMWTGTRRAPIWLVARKLHNASEWILPGPLGSSVITNMTLHEPAGVACGFAVGQRTKGELGQKADGRRIVKGWEENLRHWE